jgi:hypothetical protein
MTKSLGSHVYEVEVSGDAGSRPAFQRVSAKDAKLKEAWFRDAIFDQPELIIGVCREAGVVLPGEVWHGWAKEFPLDAGRVDVLLLSSRGRIGIIETKLSFNPERRREVVAQVLEYALSLQDVALADLPDRSKIDASTSPDEHDIADGLASGNFLLVVAGDELDPRALRLGEAVLAGHLTSEWDLAMIDLNLYANRSSKPAHHLLVPELRGVLVHETRQVVRVIVQGEKPAAKVQVERLPDPSGPACRVWDEASFLKAVSILDAPVADGIRRAFAELAQAGFVFSYGHGPKVASAWALLPAISNKDAITGLQTDGTFYLWIDLMPRTVGAQLRKLLTGAGVKAEPGHSKYLSAKSWLPIQKELLAILSKMGRETR